MGELRELSLFSGYGGLSLGLRLANLNVRTVAYVEWEKYPQEILKARIRDGFLDDAPIFGDVSAFRGEQFRGLVDIITAGFPCPPFSVAGNRKGSSDPRNKWPETLRVISEVRPSIVLLENVPGILTASRKRGTPSYGAVVVGQLAKEGYVVRWETLGADDINAPHRRKRWLCIGVLADSQSERYRGRSGSQRGDEGRLVQSEEQEWREVGSEAEGRNGELAYPGSGRHRESEEEVRTGGNTTEHGNRQLDDPQHIRLARPQETGSLGQGSIWTEEGQNPTEQPARSGVSSARADELADTNSQRGCGRDSKRQDAEDVGQPPETQGRYGNHPIWPPRPDDIEGWIAVLNERPDLAPALTKDALSTICGVADGATHRVDRLKATGNGVVPGVVAEFLRRVSIADRKGGA